jgi:flagellar basal-body rod modification protein FlgD
MSSAVSAVTSTTGTSSSTTSTSTSSSSTATKEMFLQLLVAQIKNQDPLNPTDSIQFVSQLAQFSELEQMIAIRSDADALASAISDASSTTQSSSTSTTDTSSTGTSN